MQSNYIPWKGYFNLIDECDEFIIYDDVQYTRRDWRNRNKIKTSNGLKWLTLPVEVKGKYYQTIRQTKISDTSWAQRHWRQIELAYRNATHFNEYAPVIQKWYEEASSLIYLSDINRLFIRRLCQFLEIETKISSSHDFELAEGRSEKLLKLCLDTGASCYLSGPAAKDYLDENLFREHGIDVQWMNYGGYQEYFQEHDKFEHAVTILDVIFNCGPNSHKYVVGKHHET